MGSTLISKNLLTVALDTALLEVVLFSRVSVRFMNSFSSNEMKQYTVLIHVYIGFMRKGFVSSCKDYRNSPCEQRRRHGLWVPPQERPRPELLPVERGSGDAASLTHDLHDTVAQEGSAALEGSKRFRSSSQTLSEG